MDRFKTHAAADVVASPIEKQEDLAQTLGEIDPGVYDFVLRCVTEPFKGKFIYINMSEEGEVIGSGDPLIDPQYEDVSLCIEGSSIEKRHSIIRCKEDYSYLLENVSKDGGTWVEMKGTFELSKYLKRAYVEGIQISLAEYMFNIKLDLEDTTELGAWITKVGLSPQSLADLHKRGISTLAELACRGVPIGIENELLMTRSLGELVADNFRLIVEMTNTKKQTDEKGHIIKFAVWESYKMGSSKILQLPCMESEEVQPEHFEFINEGPVYKFRVIPPPSEKRPPKKKGESNPEYAKVWRKLIDREKYILSPMDEIKLGNLIFRVERMNVGTVAEKGMRGNMEDAFLNIQDLQITNKLFVSFFAIFDGHGGPYCAKFAEEHMGDIIREKLMRKDIHGLLNTKYLNKSVMQALNDTIFTVDQRFYREEPDRCKYSGATACTVIIVGSRVFCANVGDSRAVLSRKGNAIDLSIDHKASRQDEMDRVKAAGGEITFGRVNHALAISRALGDFQYKFKEEKEFTYEDMKTAMVTSIPEIRFIDIDPNMDEFILIASDGLYDKFSSQEAITYVRNKLLTMPYMSQEPTKAAREIVNEAIYARNSRDNTTAIVICLNRGIKE